MVENIIAVVNGLTTDGTFSKKDYQLCVTSDRLVCVNTHNTFNSAFPGVLFGVVGAVAQCAIIEGAKKIRGEKPKPSLTPEQTTIEIDNILLSDKDSFVFAHKEIKRVELREGVVGGELRIKTTKGVTLFSIDKKQVDNVYEALLKVDALSDRFYV